MLEGFEGVERLGWWAQKDVVSHPKNAPAPKVKTHSVCTVYIVKAGSLLQKKRDKASRGHLENWDNYLVMKVG